MDSQFSSTGWLNRSQVEGIAYPVSVGILLESNDEGIKIAGDVSYEVARVITIPKCAIKRMRTLKVTQSPP